MNRQPFQISGGRTVRPNGHHDDKWLLDGNRVTVTQSNGDVVVVDEVGREVHRGPVRPVGRTSSKTACSDGSRHGDSARRFVTLNTFVDQVMRYVSPVEAAVWLVLFRDCRNGQASASHRDLARRTGCSIRSINKAMGRLREASLISPVKLSACKGTPSLYAISPSPEVCVPALASQLPRKQTGTGANRAPDDDQTKP